MRWAPRLRMSLRFETSSTSFEIDPPRRSGRKSEISGGLRIAIAEEHSPVNLPRVMAAARARGLHVEVVGKDSVDYVPFNTTAGSALVIEDGALAARVVERMRAAGVPCDHVEVD